MIIPVCPRCGGVGEVHAKAKCLNPAVEYFDEDGSEVDISEVRIRAYGAVRCNRCKRIRRDLMIVDGSLEVRAVEGRGPQ